MKKSYIIFISWLIMVIIWNYKYPYVPPSYDVCVAVLLSLLSKLFNKINLNEYGLNYELYKYS